jgi:hypothetical protein
MFPTMELKQLKQTMKLHDIVFFGANPDRIPWLVEEITYANGPGYILSEDIVRYILSEKTKGTLRVSLGFQFIKSFLLLHRTCFLGLCFLNCVSRR